MPAPDSSEATLPDRVFGDTRFQVTWAVCVFTLAIGLWWVRDALLVLLVHGSAAYFQEGVRVLPGKPIRFSTGDLAPQWADLLTGFGFFFFTVFGVTALLYFILRVYDRFRSSR
jgi:hypothetical protein